MAKKPLLAPHIMWRKIENSAVVLNLETTQYYTFNEVGAKIIEMAARGLNSEKMAEDISYEYKVEKARALKDIGLLQSKLVKVGILRLEGEK